MRPVRKGLFLGELDIGKIPSSGRRLMSELSVLVGVWKVGDCHDWKAIEARTGGPVPLLLPGGKLKLQTSPWNQAGVERTKTGTICKTAYY